MQKPFSDIKIQNTEYKQEMTGFSEKLSFSEKPVKKSKTKLFLWIFAVFSIIALFFGISGYFTRATIFVSPRVKTFSFKEEPIRFSRNDESGVHFEIMSLKGFVEGDIHLEDTSTAHKKAKGKIMIYNKEKTAVTLSKGTSLKGSNELLYTLTDTVVIPKAQDGGIATSVEAQIEGSDFGDVFNSDVLDFTFPKFVKTSKFLNVYARSIENISGGIKGTVYTIDNELYKTELIKLDELLKDKLFIQAKAQAPNGYILYKDLSLLIPENISETFESKNKDSFLKREGKLVIYMVSEKSLLEYVKTTTKTDESIETFTVPELQSFNFSFSEVIETPELTSMLNVFLTANGRMVSLVNKNELKQLLLGVSKSNVQKMLQNFPSVATAVTKISPIWQNILPKDENRLEIIVNPPKELTLE